MSYAGKYRSAGFKPADIASTLVREEGTMRADSDARRYPSRTTAGHSTSTNTHRYTGSAMIGIATMHKSNAVPVFSQEEAEQLATMRRS